MTDEEKQRWAVICDFIESQGGDPLFGKGKIVTFLTMGDTCWFVGKIAWCLGNRAFFSKIMDIPGEGDIADAEHRRGNNVNEEELTVLANRIKWEVAQIRRQGRVDFDFNRSALVLDITWLEPADSEELEALPHEWLKDD